MLKKSLFAAAALFTGSLAQDFVYCANPIAQKNLVALIEGDFINQKQSRVKASIEWHHNTAAQDSFFIDVPNKEKLLYVTAGDYRYVVYTSAGAKRQIGGRHLRERMGSIPLRFDDLELLANGWFTCPDSTADDPKVLTTAIPESQAVLTLDTLPQPTNINFQRWSDNRTYEISGWSEISGVSLPTEIKISGRDFSGIVKFKEKQPKPEALPQEPAANQNQNQ